MVYMGQTLSEALDDAQSRLVIKNREKLKNLENYTFFITELWKNVEDFC